MRAASAPEDNGTRAVVVRLLPNGAQERKLRKLADAASKLWNELNYERGTSSHCAYHDEKFKRSPRGVITCPAGHKLHSDLNGALNILKRGSGALVQGIPGSPRSSWITMGSCHQQHGLHKGR